MAREDGLPENREMMAGYAMVGEKHEQCRIMTPIQEVAQCMLAGQCRHNCSAAAALIRRLEQHLPIEQRIHPCLRTRTLEISSYLCLSAVKGGSCRHFKNGNCQPPFALLLAKVAQAGENALPMDQVEQPGLVETSDGGVIQSKRHLPVTVAIARILPQPVDEQLAADAIELINKWTRARLVAPKPPVNGTTTLLRDYKPFICDHCHQPMTRPHEIPKGGRSTTRLCDHCYYGS